MPGEDGGAAGGADDIGDASGRAADQRADQWRQGGIGEFQGRRLPFQMMTQQGPDVVGAGGGLDQDVVPEATGPDDGLVHMGQQVGGCDQ